MFAKATVRKIPACRIVPAVALRAISLTECPSALSLTHFSTPCEIRACQIALAVARFRF